jgi:hypothetical protein
MKICEYEVYKAVYCGLCKHLANSTGRFPGLRSAMILRSSPCWDVPYRRGAGFFPQTLLLNPLKKMPCCGDCEQMKFAGGVAMMMFYYKALDNYNDGGFGEKTMSLLYMPFARHSFQKAAGSYPKVAQIMYETISKQSLLENELCDSVDRACEPTALALSGICGCFPPMNPSAGYCIGSAIFSGVMFTSRMRLMILRKISKGTVTTLFCCARNITSPDAEQLACIRENAKGSLFLTIGELIKAYELLELHRYKPILDNIVHLGLRSTVERILLPKETERT